MKKVNLVAACTLFLCISAFANSYEPLSMVERYSDYLVIGKIENIEEGIATLHTSDMMRNLSRQPSRKRESVFQVKALGAEYKVGDFGIWALRSLNRSNSLFSASRFPQDYPDHARLAQLIRDKEYIHQGSRWVGVWRSEEGDTEIYLGESGFGYVQKRKEVVHCLWSADPEQPISVLELDLEGKFKVYDLFESVDADHLYGRTTKARLMKIEDNQSKVSIPFAPASLTP